MNGSMSASQPASIAAGQPSQAQAQAQAQTQTQAVKIESTTTSAPIANAAVAPRPATTPGSTGPNGPSPNPQTLHPQAPAPTPTPSPFPIPPSVEFDPRFKAFRQHILARGPACLPGITHLFTAYPLKEGQTVTDWFAEVSRIVKSQTQPGAPKPSAPPIPASNAGPTTALPTGVPKQPVPGPGAGPAPSPTRPTASAPSQSRVGHVLGGPPVAPQTHGPPPSAGLVNAPRPPGSLLPNNAGCLSGSQGKVMAPGGLSSSSSSQTHASAASHPISVASTLPPGRPLPANALPTINAQAGPSAHAQSQDRRTIAAGDHATHSASSSSSTIFASRGRVQSTIKLSPVPTPIPRFNYLPPVAAALDAASSSDSDSGERRAAAPSSMKPGKFEQTTTKKRGKKESSANDSDDSDRSTEALVPKKRRGKDPYADDDVRRRADATSATKGRRADDSKSTAEKPKVPARPVPRPSSSLQSTTNPADAFTTSVLPLINRDALNKYSSATPENFVKLFDLLKPRTKAPAGNEVEFKDPQVPLKVKQCLEVVGQLVKSAPSRYLEAFAKSEDAIDFCAYLLQRARRSASNEDASIGILMDWFKVAMATVQLVNKAKPALALAGPLRKVQLGIFKSPGAVRVRKADPNVLKEYKAALDRFKAIYSSDSASSNAEERPASKTAEATSTNAVTGQKRVAPESASYESAPKAKRVQVKPATGGSGLFDTPVARPVATARPAAKNPTTNLLDSLLSQASLPTAPAASSMDPSSDVAMQSASNPNRRGKSVRWRDLIGTGDLVEIREIEAREESGATTHNIQDLDREGSMFKRQHHVHVQKWSEPDLVEMPADQATRDGASDTEYPEPIEESRDPDENDVFVVRVPSHVAVWSVQVVDSDDQTRAITPPPDPVNLALSLNMGDRPPPNEPYNFGHYANAQPLAPAVPAPAFNIDLSQLQNMNKLFEQFGAGKMAIPTQDYSQGFNGGPNQSMPFPSAPPSSNPQMPPAGRYAVPAEQPRLDQQEYAGNSNAEQRRGPGTGRANKRPCRYFQTPQGCRAGRNCPFSHEESHVQTRY